MSVNQTSQQGSVQLSWFTSEHGSSELVTCSVFGKSCETCKIKNNFVIIFYYIEQCRHMNVSYSEAASHMSSFLKYFFMFFCTCIFSKNKTIVNCIVAIQVKVHLQCSAVKV